MEFLFIFLIALSVIWPSWHLVRKRNTPSFVKKPSDDEIEPFDLLEEPPPEYWDLKKADEFDIKRPLSRVRLTFPIVENISEVEPGGDFRFEKDPDTFIRVRWKKPAKATLPAMVFKDIAVAGASQPAARRNMALFLAGTERSLWLERDPANEYDKNAIKVFGAWKGRGHHVAGSGLLGWVPREIAAEIARDKELRDIELLPTPRTMFLPTRDRAPGLRFDIWLGGKLDQKDMAGSAGAQEDISEAGTHSGNEPDTSDTKECPVCAETIKFRAIRCRFCGEKFDSTDVARQVKTREDYFLQNRVPCRDESCTGIIGPTGRCGTCGKKYKG